MTVMRLNPRAFSSEISVGALFLSESFKEAQRRLGYLAEQRGFALITGEVGAGKTTTVRAFTSKLATGSYSILYTHVSAVRTPLRSVVEDFLSQMGEKIPFNNTPKGLRTLRESLQAVYERQRLPVLIVDDAHLLDARALLQLKTLTNFQMDSVWPLCLLLVGTTALNRTLATRELEEIRQRLLFCYHVRALRREEVESYVKARLVAAGWEHPLFPRDILDELYHNSHGNPRILNQLAGFCIMAALSAQKDLIDRNCLLQALAELRAIDTPASGNDPAEHERGDGV
jgi:general secretion pathway protein A